MLPLVSRTGLDMVTLADIADLEFVGGMFPKGMVSALVGESSAGKSWVMIAASLSVTNNCAFLPKSTEFSYPVKDTGKVMVLETEGRIKLYCQRIIDLAGSDIRSKYFVPGGNPLHIFRYQSSTDRESIEKALQARDVDLLIVDSFAAFSDVDENTNQVMACLNWFVQLATEYNVAVVFTQLANKSELKEGRLALKSLRGFSALGQIPVIVWAVDKAGREDSVKRLYQLKNNTGAKNTKDYIFQLANSTITFLGETQQNVDSRLDILNKNLSLSNKEILNLLCEAEPQTSRDTLSRWLQRNKKMTTKEG